MRRELPRNRAESISEFGDAAENEALDTPPGGCQHTFGSGVFLRLERKHETFRRLARPFRRIEIVPPRREQPAADAGADTSARRHQCATVGSCRCALACASSCSMLVPSSGQRAMPNAAVIPSTWMPIAVLSLASSLLS